MNGKTGRSKDPDILAVPVALRRAAKRALQLGLETGTPVWVIKDGRMVDLTRGQQRKGQSRTRMTRGRACPELAEGSETRRAR
jgi:hypothetical protein